jgi:hypothetical protein
MIIIKWAHALAALAAGLTLPGGLAACGSQENAYVVRSDNPVALRVVRS